ncbi:response regulator transcription factor [Hydrogenophaga crocea]|uniref:Response regulator transcription factor n=1 Tax=Hydrogenophaga crocea TaxID=2716225 RepID=A0A6G8IJ95_9BURK|nr:response regulator transcription factor [Hydrogenophaga crocea]QIM53098.1 response regulator transcription factor [Hydrogenophaga crocea]
MRILVAEDDPRLLVQLDNALQAAGYAVDLADNGVDAAHLGLTRPPDAVVLDLGLPGRDGLSVLRHWREAGSTVPVLVLTARGSWQDKVHGMDAGADDYLAKPFELEELLARLRALLRRASGLAHPVLQHGPLRLDTRTRALQVDGRAVDLTAFEYRLLNTFLHHPGRVLSRAELVEKLYDDAGERDSNTLDVFIARLRRKLPEGSIATVRGQGFKLQAPGA